METMEETKPKRGKKKMDASFYILCVIAFGLIVIGYWIQGWALPLSGMVRAGQMFWDIAPHLILGFALAGMIQVLIPTEYIARTLGEGSGFKGILIGTVAGALAPGGPYVNVPVVASLYKSGAGVGPLAAFLTAWGLIPISRIFVYEIPFLGTQLAFARYAASVIFPPVIGVLTSALFKLGK